MRKKSLLLNLLIPALAGLLAAGCASYVQDVPFTVNSEPPGSFVLLQTKIPAQNLYDWVYMGTTPLSFEREMDFRQLRQAESISLRMLKEGYFEQVKTWSPEDFYELYDDEGGISWDPHLVPMAAGQD